MKKKKLLPGNVKHRVKTELPVQAALAALDKEWVTQEHLDEVYSIALVRTMISECEFASTVMKMIDILKTRTPLIVSKHDAQWIQGVMPAVIAEIFATKNTVVDEAIMKAMAFVEAKTESAGHKQSRIASLGSYNIAARLELDCFPDGGIMLSSIS